MRSTPVAPQILSSIPSLLANILPTCIECQDFEIHLHHPHAAYEDAPPAEAGSCAGTLWPVPNRVLAYGEDETSGSLTCVTRRECGKDSSKLSLGARTLLGGGHRHQEQEATNGVKLASLRTEQGCYERGETGMVTRNKKVLATSRIDRPNSSRFFGNARALAGNRTPAIEEGGRGLGCRSLSEEASPFSAEDEIGEDELKQKNNGHVKSAAGT